MTTSNTGRVARANGEHFEEEIEKSFIGYSTKEVAYLDFMPVPTKAIMMAGRMVRVGDGKAPFDVYGYAPSYPVSGGDATFKTVPIAFGFQKIARFIGAELKSTADPDETLPIVAPEKEGRGIQYHQLLALHNLSIGGGIARIVWYRAGQIGVLTNEHIVAAFAIYEQSRASELCGKGKGTRGGRSIPWSAFKEVDYAIVGGVPCIDWLLL